MLHCATLVELTGKDTLPEWSKGVDSSSTSASCVGSIPIGVICTILYAVRCASLSAVRENSRIHEIHKTEAASGTFENPAQRKEKTQKELQPRLEQV